MEDKNTKLSFLQFLDTVRWLFVYNIKLAPVAAIFNAFASVFSTASPLVNAYIFARLLDDVIKIATTHGDPKEVVSMLGSANSEMTGMSLRAYDTRLLRQQKQRSAEGIILRHFFIFAQNACH